MFSLENTDQLKMKHHTTQELELQAKLLQQKRLLASPIVSSLPDGGEKIQKKIVELEHLLKTLQEVSFPIETKSLLNFSQDHCNILNHYVLGQVKTK